MILSTRIIRTPFGLPRTQIRQNLTEIDEWKQLRRKFAHEHFRTVADALADLAHNPVGITSGYRHSAGPAEPIGEWWTIITHDGPPE